MYDALQYEFAYKDWLDDQIPSITDDDFIYE